MWILLALLSLSALSQDFSSELESINDKDLTCEPEKLCSKLNSACYQKIMTAMAENMKADPECKFDEEFRIKKINSLVKNLPTTDEESGRLYACNKAFKQALLCGLTKDEQEFMAAVLVTWGEARGASTPYLVEYHGIRNVLENRLRLTNQREEYGQLNILHMALQDHQFSLFNADDPNWLMAFKAGPSIEKSINAWNSWPTSRCSPQAECDGIIGYHARWLKQEDVRWALTPEGEKLPIASFSFDGISQTQSKLSKVEQNKRHWFYSTNDPENFFYYTVELCEQKK